MVRQVKPSPASRRRPLRPNGSSLILKRLFSRARAYCRRFRLKSSRFAAQTGIGACVEYVRLRFKAHGLRGSERVHGNNFVPALVQLGQHLSADFALDSQFILTPLMMKTWLSQGPFERHAEINRIDDRQDC